MSRQIPNGIYRHYKGGLYVVVGTVRNSTNGPQEGQEMVLYYSLLKRKSYVREAEQFAGTVEHKEKIVERFTRVEE